MIIMHSFIKYYFDCKQIQAQTTLTSTKSTVDANTLNNNKNIDKKDIEIQSSSTNSSSD